MKFTKGNKKAQKPGRKCGNWPFCLKRIPEKARSHRIYCSAKCRSMGHIYENNRITVKKRVEISGDHQI